MNDLFNNITEVNKEKIHKSLESNTLHFKKNTAILSSIKKYNIICIVLEGYLQIIKTDYNGDRTIIEELYDNDIFGSRISSISNDEYSVMTKEDSKIIIIYFDEIINNQLNSTYYNQFLKNLLSILSDKINKNNERVEILTNKTIRNKLLAYFKIIYKKNKSNIIYLPYTYTDLADYLGVDRSAMYRELKHLKEEGLIKINNRKIVLNIYEDVML